MKKNRTTEEKKHPACAADAPHTAFEQSRTDPSKPEIDTLAKMAPMLWRYVETADAAAFDESVRLLRGHAEHAAPQQSRWWPYALAISASMLVGMLVGFLVS